MATRPKPAYRKTAPALAISPKASVAVMLKSQIGTVFLVEVHANGDSVAAMEALGDALTAAMYCGRITGYRLETQE